MVRANAVAAAVAEDQSAEVRRSELECATELTERWRAGRRAGGEPGHGWRGSTLTPTILPVTAPAATPLAPTEGGRLTSLAEVRAEANRESELLRADGKIGSSLQEEVAVSAGPKRLAELEALGDDLRFVLITSAARLVSAGDTADASEFFVHVTPSTAAKCERCWHYRSDVGTDPAYPTICGRCTGNLFGAGEPRRIA